MAQTPGRLFIRIAATASTAAAATATSGDADVPGWLGDPGDRRVPGTAAAAAAA
ncbi:MAG: hypothetical protein ABIS38_02365 [Sphingomicrobium sp.]